MVRKFISILITAVFLNIQTNHANVTFDKDSVQMCTSNTRKKKGWLIFVKLHLIRGEDS